MWNWLNTKANQNHLVSYFEIIGDCGFPTPLKGPTSPSIRLPPKPLKYDAHKIVRLEGAGGAQVFHRPKTPRRLENQTRLVPYLLHRPLEKNLPARTGCGFLVPKTSAPPQNTPRGQKYGLTDSVSKPSQRFLLTFFFEGQARPRHSEVHWVGPLAKNFSRSPVWVIKLRPQSKGRWRISLKPNKLLELGVPLGREGPWPKVFPARNRQQL